MQILEYNYNNNGGNLIKSLAFDNKKGSSHRSDVLNKIASWTIKRSLLDEFIDLTNNRDLFKSIDFVKDLETTNNIQENKLIINDMLHQEQVKDLSTFDNFSKSVIDKSMKVIEYQEKNEVFLEMSITPHNSVVFVNDIDDDNFSILRINHEDVILSMNIMDEEYVETYKDNESVYIDILNRFKNNAFK